MKRILLSSAAIISFAGVAAADGHLGVTFSGSAELGFNDTSYANGAGSIDSDDTDAAAGAISTSSGFYSDLDVTIGFAAELDNGLTAAASIDLEDLADGAEATEYELSLTSADSGLYYGDTNFAAQNVWVSAGDMAADNFSEADGEEVLRAEIGFGNIAAQMSYANGGGVTGADTLEQLSLGVSADFGNVNVVAAYQDAASAAFTASRDGSGADVDGDGFVTAAANGDFNGSEVFGLSVGTSFAGADVRLAYADNGTEDSTGISVSYPVGPVTVDASYAVNSVSDDTWDLAVAYENGPIAVTVSTDEGDDWGLEGSYDVGNGLMVYAGVVDAGEDFYIGGEYDLGSGAALVVSFADDGDNDEDADDDDIGAQDYMVGTTVELSFEF